ncbi:MAG TPA: hypothetical protein PLC76_02690 [Saprospiraceae bacterium]|nr:hypothetical protein [Saprospiraceae bacterium]
MKKVFYKLLLSRLILPFCISFIISDQASGQDRSIRFLNKLTERPVADVVVNCNRTGDFMSSNEAGFITLPEGTTSIWVSCIGYLTMAISTDTLKYTNDKTTILMEPTIMTLEEIIITSGMQQSVYKEISDLDIHMRPINNSAENGTRPLYWPTCRWGEGRAAFPQRFRHRPRYGYTNQRRRYACQYG